jgi:RHS repeat-associated protein
MVYNDGDQLVRWPGMYRYSYDGAGNLVQVRNDSQTQVLKSYTYSPAGLLATATFRDKDGNTRTLSNTWDADSNRVSFDANGTEYELVYDTTAGVPAVIEESTSGSTAYYIREPGGSLIARVHPTEGIRYYHFDELGSTRLLTDGSGNVTDKYAYDAYGSLLAHDRSAGSVSQPYQYVGQLGYYAHYMEPDFGLLQLGVRFYDAEVGRFTQRDPAGYGHNHYAYVDDAPTFFLDPAGLLPIPLPQGYCLELLGDIKRANEELRKRFLEMLEDKYHLYETYCEDSTKRVWVPFVGDVGNWVGHQEQYCNWQRRLNKLLRDWDKNCKCSGLKLPKHLCLKNTGPPKVNRRHLLPIPRPPCTPKKGPVSPYNKGC